MKGVYATNVLQNDVQETELSAGYKQRETASGAKYSLSNYRWSARQALGGAWEAVTRTTTRNSQRWTRLHEHELSRSGIFPDDGAGETSSSHADETSGDRKLAQPVCSPLLKRESIFPCVEGGMGPSTGRPFRPVNRQLMNWENSQGACGTGTTAQPGEDMHGWPSQILTRHSGGKMNRNWYATEEASGEAHGACSAVRIRVS